MTDPQDSTDTTRTVANDWYQRSSTVAVGHYKTAEYLAQKHRRLSGWSAVLSAIVGTAVFGTLQSNPDNVVKIVVGLLSVVAAVLATISTSMGYQEKAESHRMAGAKYNSVGRSLELLRAAPTIDVTQLGTLRDRLDALAAEMPHIPKHVHEEIAKYEDIGKWGSKHKKN